ncbi:MAG: hypothetical protein AAF614_34405 [Chloroflexota bacterium]
MGQYYLIANLDRREYLNPLKSGDGLKLREFGFSAYGTMSALALLLAKSSGTGGGDFESEMTGAWAGNRIVIIGDYDESGLFQQVSDEYADISLDLVRVMMQDEYCGKKFRENGRYFLLKDILDGLRGWE